MRGWDVSCRRADKVSIKSDESIRRPQVQVKQRNPYDTKAPLNRVQSRCIVLCLMESVCVLVCVKPGNRNDCEGTSRLIVFAQVFHVAWKTLVWFFLFVKHTVAIQYNRRKCECKITVNRFLLVLILQEDDLSFKHIDKQNNTSFPQKFPYIYYVAMSFQALSRYLVSFAPALSKIVKRVPGATLFSPSINTSEH